MEKERNILEQMLPKNVKNPPLDFFANLAKQTTENFTQNEKKSNLKVIYLSISAAAAIFILAFWFLGNNGFNNAKSNIGNEIAKVETSELNAFVSEEQFGTLGDTKGHQFIDTIQKKQIKKPVNANAFEKISTEELSKYLEEMDLNEEIDENCNDIINY